MAEEKEVQQQTAQEPENDQDIAQVIDDMRKNTVSKEEYDKVKKQSLELARRLAKGDFDPQKEEPKAKADPNELRKTLQRGDVTNLDYCKAALELRKIEMERTGRDIFLPNGHNYAPSQSDADEAQKVADVLQECIDGCEGDSAVFTAMLQSRMRDTVLPRRTQPNFGRR
jgi:hypothetical protein